MCRFMLNLKQAGHRPGPNSTVGQQSSVNFNSFLANSNILVGNLGESLNIGDEDDEQAGDDSEIQATYTHRDVSGEYDNNGEGSAGAIEGQGDQTFFEHEGGISHDVAEVRTSSVITLRYKLKTLAAGRNLKLRCPRNISAFIEFS